MTISISHLSHNLHERCGDGGIRFDERADEHGSPKHCLILQEGQHGDKTAHGVTDDVKGFISKDLLVGMSDMLDQGPDKVSLKVHQALSPGPFAPAVPQVVVADDRDVEVFRQEGGEVFIVTCKVFWGAIQ